mmetsp:Transcript_45693/g.107272  ORF Transcript_45693/g.107272 Transcript_45693/m.107272 type:complete len:265 (+) Transcript_45693:93-887(+)
MEVSERSTDGRGRNLAVAVTLGTTLIAAVLLVAVQEDSSFDFGLQGHTRRSELVLRSATMAIRDLSDEWDASNYYKEPFEFCGKSTLSMREVKVCAEHFLGMLDDSSDPQKANGTDRMLGFPSLRAYSHCTNASTFFQVTGCIKAVTRQLSLGDIVHLQHTGGTYEDDGLEETARDTVRTAGPNDSIEGVNGGLVSRSAEQSTASYMQRINAVGRPPPLSGCEDVGVEGCEEGAIDPEQKQRMLEALGWSQPPAQPPSSAARAA